jgi:hypothetical protein
MAHVSNDGSGTDWTARRSEMFGTELRRPAHLNDTRSNPH